MNLDNVFDEYELEESFKRDLEPDPDRAAKLQDLSGHYGLPEDIVERNFDELETRKRVDQIDFDGILGKQPVLGRALSNPETSRVISDEVETLQSSEKNIRGFWENSGRGVVQRTAELTGNFLEGLGNALQGPERFFHEKGFAPAIQFGDDGISFTMQRPIEDVEQVANIGKAISKGAQLSYDYRPEFTWENFKGEMDAKSLAGFVLEQGIHSVPDMLAAAYTLPAYVTSRTEEIAEERAENLSQEVDGRLLAEAFIPAVISASLERIGAKSVFDLGGVRTGKQALKATGRAAGREGATEFLQENIEYAGAVLDTDVDYEALVGLERGFAGMIAGAGFGGALRGATANIEAGLHKLARSNQEQDVLDEFEGLANSKLADRSPEKFKSYIDDLSESYGVDTVNVDADVFNQESQKHPSLQEYFNGEDVELPMSEYVTLPQDARAALRPHVRLGVDSLSQVESQSFVEREDSDIARLVVEAQKSVENYARATDIYRTVADQIAETGAYSKRQSELMARIVPAYVVTKADREGLSVDDVWGQLGLSIQSPGEGVAPTDGVLSQKNNAQIRLFPGGAVIELSEASDLSSFFHESGHLFLAMEQRFSESAQATDRQRKDFDLILGFLEVESADQIQVEQHEKFARAFEHYIAEGKAPSIELKGVFRRFAQWMANIYRTLTALDVEMDDSIRGVFDRMLATDDQIERAQQKFGFDIAVNAVEDAQAAKDKGKESLRSLVIKELRARQSKERRKELKQRTERIKTELSEEKRFKAIDALKDIPMDRAGAVEALGVENMKGLTKLNGLTKAGGMAPDDAAQMLGYDSAQHLLQDILDNPTLKQEAEARAEQEMLRAHGDILNDGQIEALADKSIHNEEQGKALLAQLKAINKRSTLDREALKAHAQEVVGKLQSSKIKPEKYHRAEVNAARAYERALSAGDQRLAAFYKQEQVKNFYIAREAQAAKDRVERMRKTLKGYQTREYRTTEVDAAYAQNLRTYTTLYDFRKADKPLSQTQLQSIAGWLKSQILDENQFLKPQILDVTLSRLLEGDPVDIKSYSEMTVDELQGVHDMARHLRWVGGQLSDAAKAKRKAQGLALAQSVDENSGREDQPVRDYSLRSDRVISDIRRFVADHSRLRNVIDLLDGFKDGIAKKLLYDPIVDASYREVEMSMSATEQLKEIFDPVDTKLMMRGRGRQTIRRQDGRNWTLGARERVMLALYWGSPESREAVMEGHGVTESDVARMLGFLTDSEIDFVEKIWAFNDQYWADFAAMNVRMHGVAPPKVDKVPFSIGGRDLKGGYMRIYYEHSVKDVSRQGLEGTAKEVMSGSGTLSMSKSGAANARVGSGGRRLDLEPNNIARATEETIHAIAFSEVSRDVSRLVMNKDFATAVEKKYGREKYNSLFDAYFGIFAGNNVASSPFTSFAKWVRSSLTYAYLAYSVRNFVQQPIALTNVFGKVGEAQTIRAVVSFAHRPMYWMDFAKSRSPFMQDRLALVNREASEQLGRINTSKGMYTAKRWAFAHQTIGDALVAYPAWIAGFNQGLERYGDEGKAARHADEIVSATVGSGLSKDLSPMLSGSGIVGPKGNPELAKQITFMGSFFNVVFNLINDSVQSNDLKTVRGQAEFARQMTWYLVAPALLSQMVISSFWDEDEDGFWAWAMKSVAEYGLSTVFMLREFAGASKGFEPSIPAFQFMTGGIRVVNEVGEAFEEGEVEGDDLSAIIRGVQPLVPLPGSGQVARTIDYLHSYSEGNEGEFNLYDALVEGKERNQ